MFRFFIGTNFSKDNFAIISSVCKAQRYFFTSNNRSKNHQFVDFIVGKKKNYRKIKLSGKNHRFKTKSMIS
jgi:hypothetical protein